MIGIVSFAIAWFSVLFIRYYYYKNLNKEKSAQEILNNGPFYTVTDSNRRNT